MRKTVFLLLTIIIIFCAAVVKSQVSGVGVGIHGVSTKSAVEEDKRLWAWGLHARARLTRYFAIEGSIDYRQEEIENSRLTLYPVQISGLFFMTPGSSLGLYGLFGFGFTKATTEGEFFGDEYETNLGYHWGLGVEIPFTQEFAIFVDVRYLNLELGTSEGSSPKFNTEGWQSNFGFTWYF